MRRSLILILALAILAGCGFGFSHTAISAQQDKVTVTEQVIAGDPDAAAGVRVQMRMKCADHLLWETHYAVGAPDGTYSNFTFSRSDLGDFDPYYGNIDIATFGNSSYSGAFNIDAEDGDECALHGVKLFRAVAENTDPGSTHTEVLRVRDYYEYFPLDVWTSLPGSVSDEQERQITAAIQEFFRISVPEDYRVKVTVTKEADGSIYEMSMETLGDGVSAWLNGQVAMDGVHYFTLDVESGATVSTGQSPDDVGIYRLSYGGEDVSLETVFPIDPTAETIDLHLSADASKLLLTTFEQDTYYLTVIDLQTMTELQKLPVMEDAARGVWWGANYNDDFLVVAFSTEADFRFVVLSAPETGDYAVAMRGTAPEDDPAWALDAAMDFDGETLVIATQWWYWDDTGAYMHLPRGFLLSVYDADGLRYTGQYGNSLMDESSQWATGDRNCYFTDVNPLTVTLP